MNLQDVALQISTLLQQIEMELGCVDCDCNSADEETADTMEFIPPLQTELELMKKHAGVDSAYDEEVKHAVA